MTMCKRWYLGVSWYYQDWKIGSTVGLQLPKPRATGQSRTKYESRPLWLVVKASAMLYGTILSKG